MLIFQDLFDVIIMHLKFHKVWTTLNLLSELQSVQSIKKEFIKVNHLYRSISNS